MVKFWGGCHLLAQNPDLESLNLGLKKTSHITKVRFCPRRSFGVHWGLASATCADSTREALCPLWGQLGTPQLPSGFSVQAGNLGPPGGLEETWTQIRAQTRPRSLYPAAPQTAWQGEIPRLQGGVLARQSFPRAETQPSDTSLEFWKVPLGRTMGPGRQERAPPCALICLSNSPLYLLRAAGRGVGGEGDSLIPTPAPSPGPSPPLPQPHSRAQIKVKPE